MSAISIKQLLEAGVHFGHQTSRWNPKMREYIFGDRNGIHIVDLQKTLRLFKEAVDFLTDLGAQGKQILFVGTKRQAQEAIEEDSLRCGMHFVTNRWLGGLLTNFETVRNSIKRYKELDALKAEGYDTKFSSKKEIAKLERQRKKLEKNLRGIRNLERLPDALFVIDSDKEQIAVMEARRLGIPVIAVVDTNCDPDIVDYVIPGNDDALRSVKLFTSTVSDAVAAGRSIWDAKVAEERRAREEAEREQAAKAAAARAAADARRAERERERKAAAEAAKAAAAEAAKAEAEAAKKVKAEKAAAAEASSEASTPVKAEKASSEASAPVKAEKASSEAPAPVKAEKVETEAEAPEATPDKKPSGPRKSTTRKAAAKSADAGKAEEVEAPSATASEDGKAAEETGQDTDKVATEP